MLNAITVDVEDYFQVSAFERSISRSSWGSYESRVVNNTRRVLDLLRRQRVNGTFFILGWVAQRFPDLVREIAENGHEVGTHSYWHHLVYKMSPADFRDDLRRSIGAIQDACGIKVVLYRAPSFSITQSSLWAMEILAEEGIQIDCSIFPVRHDRYGIPDAKPDIHILETASGPIIEFPSSTVTFCGTRIPVAGGGYFRLYPLPFTLYCIRQLNATQRPCMVYIHPWELDPLQPRIARVGLANRLRHYVNIDKTEARLERLLTEFRFGTVRAAVRNCPQGVFLPSTDTAVSHTLRHQAEVSSGVDVRDD